jgi:hypothetical protein
VSTGRVSSWDIGGKPNYLMHCKQTGTTVEEFQLEPVLADESSAAGVKIGQVVKIAIAETQPPQAPPRAVVFEVADLAGAGAKARLKPVSAWGFALKEREQR